MTAATLVHHISGRTRFRVVGRREDGPYFARLKEQLAQCPGVISVATSQLTGSVLVHHNASNADVLIAYARTMELFDIEAGAARAADTSRVPATILTGSIGQLDRWVRSESRPATDLRSLAVTGLVGAAVWQLLRGRIFPPATTLIAYALGVASTSLPVAAGDVDDTVGVAEE
jgi:hypothetical protein